jgi:superfamily II DNA or RNA helicase
VEKWIVIRVVSYNETFVRIETDDFGINQELSEHFTIDVPGAKFSPKYRSGIWDGRIRIFNQRTKLIYKGLVDIVFKFARANNYPIQLDPVLKQTHDITYESVKAFMEGLQLFGRGKPIELRDYQIEAVHKALSNDRLILESATSSGKSLIIYTIIRYFIDRGLGLVLIVPTVNLVNQMTDDFKDYSSKNGWDVDLNVHSLYSGKERIFDKSVTVSTWQSIASMRKSDPKNYTALTSTTDVLLADEAHTLKAAVVSAAIEGFVDTKRRIGLTGTMDNALCNILVLTGLLGQVHQIISASQLISAGQAVPIEIRVMVLKHPAEWCKILKGMDYREEMKQIISNPARNKFITNLALATEGNTLILFRFVENHGKILYNLIKEKAAPGRPVYFIHGGVAVAERDRIRKILDTDKDAIIVATDSLMATGVNIPSINQIIFACPSKSAIRIRQSIGRALRLNAGKCRALIFDIADDYRHNKKKNVTFRHMEERLGIYIKSDFPYKILQLNLSY